ncbi:MAG TPA: polysaccharide deacetylase family protein [Polyangia bacterium]
MSDGRLLFFASTLLLAATAATLPIFGTKMTGVGAALLCGYLALLLVGVMLPRLTMFAPALLRMESARGEVALTFDDGPSPASTRKVLATLARFDARATFFVLGEKVRAAPDVLREIANAGHAIGIHGDTHDRLFSFRHPNRIVADIERAQDTVAKIIGQRPSLFRPPLGHVSPRTAVAARRLGLTLVGWSVRARDGLVGTTTETVRRRVFAGLEPGAIVLLHDAAERGERTPAGVTALPGILEEAARRGLRCVSLASYCVPS